MTAFDGIDLIEVWDFAIDAHGTQKDKGGRPYAFHLSTTWENTRMLGGDRAEQAAAILHDVLEDTIATEADLQDIPVPQATIDIVKVVTKKKNEQQKLYLERIVAGGRGAMRVKLADLYNNTEKDRLEQLDWWTQKRLLKKYTVAVERLESELWIEAERGTALFVMLEKLEADHPTTPYVTKPVVTTVKPHSKHWDKGSPMQTSSTPVGRGEWWNDGAF